MNLIISLDYELFFGTHTGTVERCLINPTNALLNIVNKHDILLSFFIDAGFLYKLNIEKTKHKILEKDFLSISAQLQQLKNQGHDIQLHIHPHWEDSYFDGQKWNIVSTRYKLHNYSIEEQINIVKKYKEILVNMTGDDSVFAYRAGGWCIQPFTEISTALKNNQIWLDSTIFPSGLSKDMERGFDFQVTPDKDFWNFEKDPLVENTKGYFLEVPISSYKVSPLFFWKLACYKTFSSEKHKTFGDGSPLKADNGYYLDKLIQSSFSVVSIDGYKASLLDKIYFQHKKLKKSLINIMGHPKSLTSYSIAQLDSFLCLYKNDLDSITFQHFKK